MRVIHWHRRDHPPRPVLVVEELTVKVRVVDLVESGHRGLVLRDVMPGNLSTATEYDRRLARTSDQEGETT